MIITVVIVTALIQLIKNLWPLVIGGALDPLDHEVFQSLFDMMMTLLIALSLEFLILDPNTKPARIAALAAATLALGGVYWLLRERDDTQEMKADFAISKSLNFR